VDGRSSASSSSPSSSSSSISGRIVACHRCERISVRERTEQKREREEEFIYIKKKNPTPGPRPKKQILFLIIPFLVFPLACLVFFGIFFPDRVWQSSLRLEEERERERERERDGGVLWDLSGAVFMDHFKDLYGGFGAEFGLKCRSRSL
jgi:hypothetical protein